MKSDSLIVSFGALKSSKGKGCLSLSSSSSSLLFASDFWFSASTRIIRCSLFFKLSKTATSSESMNNASGVPIVSGGDECANLSSIYLIQSYAK